LITVGDEQSVLLDVGDAEGPLREWREEGSIRGNYVELVGDGVPRHREWHTLLFVSVVKTLLSTRSRLVESCRDCVEVSLIEYGQLVDPGTNYYVSIYNWIG
jgi:hypothetical protein